MNARSDWGSLLKILSPQTGDRVLDVGAGKGELAAMISRAYPGVEVCAVDPNAKRVEVIRRDHPAVKTSVSGAENLPFPDGYFDKVYTTMAMHHFTDLGRSLGEITRVLKSGGTFVVLEVDPGSAKGILFRIFGRIMGEHMSLMRMEQLSQRLANSKGLRIVSSMTIGSSYLVQLSRT